MSDKEVSKLYALLLSSDEITDKNELTQSNGSSRQSVSHWATKWTQDVQNTHLDPTAERSNTSTNDKAISHRDLNDKLVAGGFYAFARCIMLIEQQSNPDLSQRGEIQLIILKH